MLPTMAKVLVMVMGDRDIVVDCIFIQNETFSEEG